MQQIVVAIICIIPIIKISQCNLIFWNLLSYPVRSNHIMMNHASKSFTKYAIISIIVIVVLFIYHSSKLEFARFYKRCTGRTKSAMGACSQSADFRTGCIARQRDMSMKRSVMRMAPHYDNIFSCIGCFFSFQIFTQSFPTHSSAIGEFFHISTISPSSSELLPILIG